MGSIGSPRRMAAARPVGRRPEPAVEVAGALDGADDGVEVDHAQPEVAEPPLAEGDDDLVEGEDDVDVGRRPPQS
jgi:hypothetical protein